MVESFEGLEVEWCGRGINLQMGSHGRNSRSHGQARLGAGTEARASSSTECMERHRRWGADDVIREQARAEHTAAHLTGGDMGEQRSLASWRCRKLFCETSETLHSLLKKVT